MMKKHMIMTGLVAVIIGSAAQAGLIEFETQPLYDTYVDQGPTLGSETLLRIQGQGSYFDDNFEEQNTTVQRLFLHFELPEIPSVDALESMEFGIYLSETSTAYSTSMQLWVVDNNWDADLSWNDSQLLFDTKSAIGTEEPLGGVSRYYFWDWSTLNPQAWDAETAFAEGKVSFMLTTVNEETANFAVFHKSNNEVYKPYLKLSYIPEPATLALLAMGMGGIGVFRKKR